MKKLSVIMLSLAMALTVFTACGEKEEPADEAVVRTGNLQVICANTEDASSEESDFEDVYFDDMNSMLLALQSGKIDEIFGIPEVVANYITNNNDKMKVTFPQYCKGNVLLSLATLKENQEVFDYINTAVDKLIENGTLAKLNKEYVDAYMESGENPPAVELPHIDGAKTIKIGITGDLPPIDYIAADGVPAGFNVALLAEISKIANVNFELVQITTGARLISLTEGNVDAIFYNCMHHFEDEELNEEEMKIDSATDTLSITAPYFEGKIAQVVMK